MTGFSSIHGIMPPTPGVPGVRFLTTDPVTSAYRETDQFLRGQARDALHLEAENFRLQELRRKLDQETSLDAIRREAYAPQAGEAAVGQSLQQRLEMASSPTPSPAVTSAPVATLPPNPANMVDTWGREDMARSGIVSSSDISDQTYAPSVKAIENTTGNPLARNPRSTAMGDGQFISSTWRDVWPRIKEQARPILAQHGIDVDRLTPEEVLALRGVPEIAERGINAYRDMNAPTLRAALGRDPTDGEFRMAHGFGAGGASALLRADPAANVETVLSPAAMRANPHLMGKTIGSLRAQYDSPRGFAPAAAPVAASNATPFDAPGSDPTLNARLREAYQRPEVQAISGQSWQGDTAATDNTVVTGTRSTGAPPMGTDVLRSRLDQAADRRFMQLAAGTPGAGAEMKRVHDGQRASQVKTVEAALKAASEGQPEIAMMYAQAGGVQMDPNLIRNAAMAKRGYDFLKALGPNEPVAATKGMAHALKTGDIAGAVEMAVGSVSGKSGAYQFGTMTNPDGTTQIAALDTRAGTATPTNVAGYAGNRGTTGNTPAQIQVVEYLVKNQIAKDHNEAWQLANTAKINPQALVARIYSSMAGNALDVRSDEEKMQAAITMVQRVQRMGSAGNIADPSMTPQAPGGNPGELSDPLGIR